MTPLHVNYKLRIEEPNHDACHHLIGYGFDVPIDQ